MKPPALPPNQPQIIYVERKRKTGCLTWLAALILIPVSIGIFASMVGPSGGGSGSSASSTSPLTPRQEAQRDLEIVEWKWSKDGFGSVMTATFKVQNKGKTDYKDIEIECVHSAASGTVIDRNKRTIYEIVKAGETKTFKDFNMGFIHSQAVKSSAGVRNAVAMESSNP